MMHTHFMKRTLALIADYYRYISYLDSQIGRVLDALEASPFAKNTIVVFSADSGVARGSHGLIGKQNLYEFDSVRVPLIISGPGIPADKRTDAMCYLFEVLPTLGKMCGVTGPKTSDGMEFSASLSDPAKPARSGMIFPYKRMCSAPCATHAGSSSAIRRWTARSSSICRATRMKRRTSPASPSTPRRSPNSPPCSKRKCNAAATPAR